MNRSALWRREVSGRVRSRVGLPVIDSRLGRLEVAAARTDASPHQPCGEARPCGLHLVVNPEVFEHLVDGRAPRGEFTQFTFDFVEDRATAPATGCPRSQSMGCEKLCDGLQCHLLKLLQRVHIYPRGVHAVHRPVRQRVQSSVTGRATLCVALPVPIAPAGSNLGTHPTQPAWRLGPLQAPGDFPAMGPTFRLVACREAAANGRIRKPTGCVAKSLTSLGKVR